MEKIKQLNNYQKAILLFMAIITVIYFVVYFRTISRIGFEYYGSLFYPTTENGSTIYSGKLNHEQALFTVSENKTVIFQYGDYTYGPYTVTENDTLILEDRNFENMIGLEIYEDNTLLFKGSAVKIKNRYWLYTEDGTPVNTTQNSENDRPFEPSLNTIISLMYEPTLVHKGSWFGWIVGTLICIVNTFSILYVEELFRWNLKFIIRNANQAEPSDWQIRQRYFSWTTLALIAWIVFQIYLK